MERRRYPRKTKRCHRHAPQATGRSKDDQSRYLEAAVEGIAVAAIYAPNGNPQPGPEFDYKLAWRKWLYRHATKLLKRGAPCRRRRRLQRRPTEADIYPTRSKDDIDR